MASVDFFISYTGADQVWAEWIAETLERAGHSTVMQSWDFRPGDNFIQRMNEALVDAERVVAVLSPAYFRSAVSMGGCIASALTEVSAVEVMGAVLGTVSSRTGRGVGAVAAR